MLKKDAVSKLIREYEKKESEQVLEQETAMQLISEASTKLNVSLKSNDICGAKVAQAMLSTGNSKLHDTSNQLIRIREEKQKCQQERQDSNTVNVILQAYMMNLQLRKEIDWSQTRAIPPQVRQWTLELG